MKGVLLRGVVGLCLMSFSGSWHINLKRQNANDFKYLFKIKPTDPHKYYHVIFEVDLVNTNPVAGIEVIVNNTDFSRRTVNDLGIVFKDSIDRPHRRIECDFAASVPVNQLKIKSTCKLKDVQLISINQSLEDSLNLVPNGRFNFFSKLPDRDDFNSTRGLVNWQEIPFVSSNCVETRTPKLLFPNYGSPDFVIEKPVINDSINLVGRIGCDKAKNPIDTMTAYGEYLTVKLKKAMIKGNQYRFSMRYKLDQFSKKCTNTLGIRLSSCVFLPFDAEMFNKHIFPVSTFSVSDTCNCDNRTWTTFSIIFLAKEDFQYLTIGPMSKDKVDYSSGHVASISKDNQIDGAFYLIDDIILVEK